MFYRPLGYFHVILSLSCLNQFSNQPSWTCDISNLFIANNTEEGLYKNNINSILSDFQSFNKIPQFSNAVTRRLEFYHGIVKINDVIPSSLYHDIRIFYITNLNSILSWVGCRAFINCRCSDI